MLIYQKNLIRIKQGNFSLEEAISIDDIKEDKIVKIVDALQEYEKLIVDDEVAKKVENGSILSLDTNSNMVLILNQANDLLAIYTRYDKDTSKMKPYKVFRR